MSLKLPSIPTRWALVLAAGLASAGAASAACFTVHDAANRVVYQSTTPPVDLSLPLSEAVAAVFPRNHHLLMSDDSDCPGIAEAVTLNPPPPPGARSVAGSSPALALADAFRGRHRREEAMPRGDGPITTLDARDPFASSGAAGPPKPRRRAPVSQR